MTRRKVNLTELRERAERAITESEASLFDTGGAPTGTDVHHLVEELRIYQTELEIQNEELVQAQSTIALALEKYRLLFDHLPLPGFVVDEIGFIKEANSQACGFLGLSRHVALQRGSVFQLFDYNSRKRLVEVLQDRRRPEPRTLELLELKLGSGHTIPCDAHVMHLSATPMRGAQNLLVLIDRTADLARRESDERFRLAFSNANTGMCLVDLQGNLMQVNDKMAGILGYSKLELEHMSVRELALPPDSELSQDFIDQALRGSRESLIFEKRYRHSQGHTVYAQLAYSVVHDAHGQPCYFIAQVQDITDRKQAELALQESEQRWHRALDGTGKGVWDWNVVANEAFFSPQWKAMLGYADEDIGNGIEEWEKRVHPDDLADCWRDLQRHLSGETPAYRNEHRMLCKDGHYQWMLDEGMIFEWTPDHRPRRVVGMHTDITWRKEAEERLRISEERHRLLADNATDVISTWSLAGVMTYVSPSVEKLIGWTPAETLCKPSEELLTPAALAVLAGHRGNMMANLKAGLPPGVFRAEMELRCKDGSTVWTEATVSPILDTDGKFAETLTVTRDISERKRYEHELKQAREEAESANRAKSEFLAQMSHEIRTPMNVVLGLAQVLNREPLTTNQRDIIERIQTAGQTLLSLINDVLDLSKIEAGQMRIAPETFDLGAVLTKLASLEGAAAATRGLALHITAPSAPLGLLLGDSLRLEQVLVNLIGNAIKFTEAGQVTLQVEVIENSQEAVRLHFAVQDTGIGIAPEAQEGLFNPFTQAEVCITRRFGGTGLGLSICKRLVEMMGGEIGVESQVGEGSLFWFELPFMRAVEGTSADPAAPASGLPSEPRLAGVHVLVVDDSAMNRDLVERALALEGARATLAADGQQAVQQLRERPTAFAAVLTDVRMPVMDGLAATRMIRSELGLTDLPVIALTAGVLAEQQEAARAAGVNEVLVKPLDLEQMIRCLLRWIGPQPADNCIAPRAEQTAGEPATVDEFPDIPGIDRAQAALTLGYKRALFLRLLERFVEEFATTVEQTRRDLAAGERDTAARRMHTLRGNAGTLGALEIMASAQGLEQAINGCETALEERLMALDQQLATMIAVSIPWLQATTAAAIGSGTLPPLDAGQLEQLRDELGHHNMRALRRYDELQAALRSVLGDAGTESLGRAIRGLRFTEALAILDRANTVPSE
jgi:PAS domain S-box-containing protein